jgi:hypothetical protein
MAVAKKARTTTPKAGSKNAAANPETNGNGSGNVTSIETAQQQPTQEFAEQVRRRAYEIYEQSGRPDGCAHDHWCQAEAEILRRRKSA